MINENPQLQGEAAALPNSKETTIKTYLDVPFGDKYQARTLGARWDPASKLWFVPDGTALTPFLDWVPSLPTLDKRVRGVLRSRTS